MPRALREADRLSYGVLVGFRAVAVSVALLVGSPTLAGAAPADALNAPAERRSGIVLSLAGVGGFGSGSGYPNSVSKIDRPEAYSSSGWLPGYGMSLCVMGALADALNFGGWFATTTFENGAWKSTGLGGGLRLELFPLYPFGIKDLGVAASFGVGQTTVRANSGVPDPAEGTQSTIRFGAFYEWSLLRFLGGHVSVGPLVEYETIFARSITRNALLGGARVVFYGGP
ncbi:MAG: hypothetical protein WCI05_08085 [Myxococcales bacterium]|jgi:hypothetical protein